MKLNLLNLLKASPLKTSVHKPLVPKASAGQNVGFKNVLSEEHDSPPLGKLANLRNVKPPIKESAVSVSKRYSELHGETQGNLKQSAKSAMLPEPPAISVEPTLPSTVQMGAATTLLPNNVVHAANPHTGKSKPSSGASAKTVNAQPPLVVTSRASYTTNQEVGAKVAVVKEPITPELRGGLEVPKLCTPIQQINTTNIVQRPANNNVVRLPEQNAAVTNMLQTKPVASEAVAHRKVALPEQVLRSEHKSESTPKEILAQRRIADTTLKRAPEPRPRAMLHANDEPIVSPNQTETNRSNSLKKEPIQFVTHSSGESLRQVSSVKRNETLPPSETRITGAPTRQGLTQVSTNEIQHVENHTAGEPIRLGSNLNQSEAGRPTVENNARPQFHTEPSKLNRQYDNQVKLETSSKRAPDNPKAALKQHGDASRVTENIVSFQTNGMHNKHESIQSRSGNLPAKEPVAIQETAPNELSTNSIRHDLAKPLLNSEQAGKQPVTATNLRIHSYETVKPLNEEYVCPKVVEQIWLSETVRREPMTGYVVATATARPVLTAAHKQAIITAPSDANLLKSSSLQADEKPVMVDHKQIITVKSDLRSEPKAVAFPSEVAKVSEDGSKSPQSPQATRSDAQDIAIKTSVLFNRPFKPIVATEPFMKVAPQALPNLTIQETRGSKTPRIDTVKAPDFTRNERGKVEREEQVSRVVQDRPQQASDSKPSDQSIHNGQDTQSQNRESESGQAGVRQSIDQASHITSQVLLTRPHASAQSAMSESLKFALQQALDQSRKRMLDPDELRMSISFGELGTMDIDIVREADKFLIRIAADPQAIAMMEDERLRLTQWLRMQGYPVEQLEIAARFSQDSKSDLTGSNHSASEHSSGRPKHLNGGTGDSHDEHAEAQARPTYSGLRVWTA